MNYIAGIDRNQTFFSSLEQNISSQNPVRFIDIFVEHIDLLRLGFELQTLNIEGRPSFQSNIFLKLYLYGYLNGIRSSRKLERECTRNIELQWLLNNLVPNYHTIADFRKDNPKALRQLFKMFVLFLKDADLVAAETLAIDGTKTRANNSKKNNYNQKKIERHLSYIENKTEEYLQEIERNDKHENAEKINDIQQKIDRLKGARLKYELLEKQLESSGDPQVSTTDADARALLIHGQVVEVSYNTQAAVDGKNKLVVATHTINRNDRNAMSAIATEAKENLEIEKTTVILDKGYFNGCEMQTCEKAGITTIVAPPDIVNSNENGTTPDYMVTKFLYNKESDTYTCPQGETLTTKGTWHKKSRGNTSHLFKKYRTSKCKTCPVKHLCTSRKDGREIERSEYADTVEANNHRYYSQKALYRKRQEWNEHIFGTIKRQWGYDHTNLRGLSKVNGEHSLIYLVYNIKRTMNILGIENLLHKLKNWTPRYPRLDKKCNKTTYFKPFWAHLYFDIKIPA